MSIIEVTDVSKHFKVYKRQTGFLRTVKSLITREYEVKSAVEGVSFSVNKGELVGYIGANGAGKSTTIKMLCGILTPTSGHIRVCGRVPYEQRKQNARVIGVVFGQRSQLYWDLPMVETFDLYKQMYRIDSTTYKRNVDFFVELLDMQEFLDRPVRQLSLGQKMKANLAVALLHDPEIVYLDEPTIGLDVLVKSKIRQFIRELNREKQTTVILTTHDVDDIEYICDRLMLLDKGKKIYDGSLERFKDQYSGERSLTIEFKEAHAEIDDPRLVLCKDEGYRKQYQLADSTITIAEAITVVTRSHAITDLKINEPQVEDLIKRIYERKRM
ncbi:ABC transporter ATP-binding protein [Paenibacillus sp. strain BS8-2]